ncbi:MAG: sulfotransferase [Sulfitobacter sp.]
MNDQSDKPQRVNVRDYGQTPFTFRLWHGMTLDAWLRVMRGKWHLISVRRYPLALTITLVSTANLPLKLISQALYGRKLAKVMIDPDPVFVLGHWRSGTTWLHQLMMTDPSHAAPAANECFMPETFLAARGLLSKLLAWILPESRPMDNVGLAPDSAEEDEHGIALSGAISPLHSLMFPNAPLDFPIRISDMTEKDAAFWRKKWLAFLRRVQFIHPDKRLVLKSPGHTLRTDEILSHFPNAKFVHIVRDPYKIFMSSRKTQKAMQSTCALQDHLPPERVAIAAAIQDFLTFQEHFEAARPNIPADQIVTIHYEDLRADTLGVIEKVYGDLNLGDFDLVRPSIEELIGTPKPYQNNQYELDAATQKLVEDNYQSYFKRYGYLPMAQRPKSEK